MASNTFSITYDTTKPKAAITSDKSNPTNATSFVATITFSEDVADFDETYFSLTNANYSNFVYINDALFKVTITTIADGTVSITIPSDEIEDNTGNRIVTAQFSINVDTTNPAYAGSTSFKEISLGYRSQWVGVSDAPNTQALSYTSV